MINRKIQLTLLLCLILCVCLVPAAYADGLNDLQSAVNSQAAEFTLTENTTIPANTTIDASGTKIIIPAGMTLTVNGTLIVDNFNIEQNPQLNQRGVISVPEGGVLHVKGWHDLSNNIWTNWRGTGETGRISFADGAGFILHRGDIGADGQGHTAKDVFKFTLQDGENILTEAPGHLKFDFALKAGESVDMSDEALTIPAGFIFSVKGGLKAGSLEIEQGAETSVDGGELGVMGTLLTDGSLTLNNTWADVGAISLNNIAAALEASPARISFTGDSGFVLKRNCGDEANAIHPDYGAITGAKRILDRLGTEHTRAVALIDCDVTIPESSFLDAGQGEIVIQSDKTLTVEGGLFGKTLEIEPGGSLAANGLISVDEFCDNGDVSVGGSGFIQVKRSFSIGQDVTAFTLSGTLSIKNTALSDPTQLEVVANNGMLDIYFEMLDENALLAELEAPTGNFGDHFRRSLWVLFPWELSDDLTLPGHVHLCVSAQGSDAGQLTIPAGMILTIPETGQLFTGGDEGENAVQLNGGLVNNGELALGDEMGYDPGEIAFGPKGFYAGVGKVTRLGKSYQILNDRTHADLLLPADLKKIESEALAGGVFDSVFIPDGTTSIADDAFGDREIVIFGELESFAETYARDKGYCFAPVA